MNDLLIALLVLTVGAWLAAAVGMIGGAWLRGRAGRKSAE